MLTSCSQLGATAGSTASSTTDVSDPSIPSSTTSQVVAASPTADVPTDVATDAPVPTVSSTTDAKKAVVPFITSAAWDSAKQVLDVSAIVPGVVESTGTCSVTIAMGGTDHTASSTGVGASSYTGCQAVQFSGLASGDWQVRVRYSSATSAGTSAVRTVQIG